MYWKTVKYRNINEMTRYIPSDFVQSKWESFSSALFYHYLARNQGCALSEPGGLWRLIFCPRATRKSYARHPRFYSFRALGSLQFSLEHSLGNLLEVRACMPKILWSPLLHVKFTVFNVLFFFTILAFVCMGVQAARTKYRWYRKESKLS